jgi:hypothetical protein
MRIENLTHFYTQPCVTPVSPISPISPLSPASPLLVWFYRPVEYFALLLQGIQRKVLSTNSGDSGDSGNSGEDGGVWEEDETSQSGVATMNRVSYAAQAAVILRLVHQDAHAFISV